MPWLTELPSPLSPAPRKSPPIGVVLAVASVVGLAVAYALQLLWERFG